MSITEFYELTPYEFSVVADAYCKRIASEQEERITLAYMTAQWAAQWITTVRFAEQPKSLSEILGKEEESTDEDMLSIVKALNAQMGGEVK